MHRYIAACVTVLIALLALRPAGAQDEQWVAEDPELEKLADLSFSELMQVEVTSVAGVEEQWFRTPAAMYVITGEDIRRTGHQSLAEALRLVPGMFVGRSGSRIWRIGPRGFTGGAITSTKNLVLIDGRVAYDPLFSGTFWETQDILLEDLDRIEVIRGPGATLWGSNAVNGVINVTTKSARDTQGLYITGGAGTSLEGLAAARYGDQLSENAWYRVWGKWVDYDSFSTMGEGRAHDDWSIGRVGMRIDGEGADDVSYMLEGDFYRSTTYGESGTFPVPGVSLQFDEFVGDGRVGGGHLLGRITQKTGLESGWSLQSYYDRTEREQQGVKVDRDTVDLDFRNHFGWGRRQSLVWGSRLTYTTDDVDPSPSVSFDPESRDLTTLSAFVQNTSELVEDRLFGMVGSKFEHNSHTGFEVQPSGRIWWTPSDRHTLWAAVSRAVRVPSRLEEDAIFVLSYVDSGVAGGGPPSGDIVPVRLLGNDDLESEELIAYELGHRVRLTDDLTLDTALFYHEYDRVISVPSLGLSSVTWNNEAEGDAYGVETVVGWQAAENWRLEASYSLVNTHMHGPVVQFEEGNTPLHQAQLRSYLDITRDLELNGALYFVDELENGSADDYLRLDIGVTWRPTATLELSLWGQNLLNPSHIEASREVPRGVFLQGTLRF